MRLAEGIVIDKEQTFGMLKFSAKRRDVFERDEEGKPTAAVKERTYDLKSKAAGMMVQVSIPSEAGEKNFEYDTEVDLIDPMVDTVASANYRGADVSWYIKAKDIVLKKGNSPQAKEQAKDQTKKPSENHNAG